jgi:hypothetical protein
VNPRAWLITVVKRQAFNRWRDRREVPSSGSMPEAGWIDDDSAADEIARVRLLLYSLPEAQHQAFVLRHWSGLSNREIAGVLDTSESAVESLLVRARAAIVAPGTADEECFALRRQLTDDRDLTSAQSRHVARCKGCRAGSGSTRSRGAGAGIDGTGLCRHGRRRSGCGVGGGPGSEGHRYQDGDRRGRLAACGGGGGPCCAACGTSPADHHAPCFGPSRRSQAARPSPVQCRTARVGSRPRSVRRPRAGQAQPAEAVERSASRAASGP